MAVTVKLSGFRELDQQLGRLTKAAGRGALRRSLKSAAEPLAAKMKAAAPDDPRTGGNDLRSSIGYGTKLSPRQRGMHRKMVRDDKASVEGFVGAGPVAQATFQEFGTVNHGPQPFARPSWDGDQSAFLRRLGDSLWAEISKSIARAERKAARAARAARG